MCGASGVCGASAMDWIPVLSQCKSAVQALCGDLKGAAETQDRFSKQCPIVSQTRSAVHSICGDHEQARLVQVEQAKLLEAVGTSIPVVGHVAGSIAFICGDGERAAKYMMSATRTTAVIGGAVAGGPAGAVGAAAAFDALRYGTEVLITGEGDLGGAPGAIKNMIQCGDQSKQGGNAFDLVAGLVGDAVGGKAGAKAVMNTANVVAGVSSKIPTAASALKTNAKACVGGSMEANRAASQGQKPQQQTATQTVTQAASGSGTQAGTDQDSSTPLESNQENEVGSTVHRATDTSTPEPTPTVTAAEEEPTEEKERKHINVHDHNSDLVGGVIVNFVPHDVDYNILVATQHLAFACEEFAKLSDLFINLETQYLPDPRLYPDVDGQEKVYESPLTPTEAKCEFKSGAGGAFVCVKGKGARSITFCAMTTNKLSMTTGISEGGRAQVFKSVSSGLTPFDTWIGGKGALLDRIVVPDGGHNSLREVQGETAFPGDLPSTIPDICAEHHAAVFIYENGEIPVSSIALRMDQHRRIYPVERCKHCAKYDFGTVLTDHIPAGTWLNAPKNLRVYTDTT